MMVAAALGFTLVAIVLQATVFCYIQVFGVKPDLVVAIVASIAILKGSRDGAVTGFLAGLLLDAVRGELVGALALSYMAAGAVIGFAEERVFKDNLFLPAVATAAATLVSYTVFIMLANSFGITIPYVTALLRQVLPAMLYSAFFAPPIYAFFWAWYQRMLARGQESGAR